MNVRVRLRSPRERLLRSAVWSILCGVGRRSRTPCSPVQGDALAWRPIFENVTTQSSLRVRSGETVLVGGGAPSSDGQSVVYIFLTAQIIAPDGSDVARASPEEWGLHPPDILPLPEGL